MPGNLIMSTGWPYYILPPVQQSGAYNTKYMIQTCTTCFCVPFSSMISEHFLFLISTTPASLDHILGVISTTLLRKVPRLTSCGSQAGDQCLLKGGICLFRLAQLKISYGWWSMAHYLELNRSQDAPKHCPTFDSLTQCFASANFRSPPVRLQFCLPPYSITDLHSPVQQHIYSAKYRKCLLTYYPRYFWKIRTLWTLWKFKFQMSEEVFQVKSWALSRLQKAASK